MNKVFFLVIAIAWCMPFGLFAQHRIESPHPDLSVKISRCVEASGTVVVDMVMTNLGKDDIIRFGFTPLMGPFEAYDDEGNVYKTTNTKISFGLVSLGLSDDGFVDITFPQDIALKVRLQVEKVDKNASKFSLIKMPVSSVSSNRPLALSDKLIQIRNLEFERQ